jgi:hypothetical protein
MARGVELMSQHRDNCASRNSGRVIRMHEPRRAGRRLPVVGSRRVSGLTSTAARINSAGLLRLSFLDVRAVGSTVLTLR